jgi:hypothetical protein
VTPDILGGVHPSAHSGFAQNVTPEVATVGQLQTPLSAPPLKLHVPLPQFLSRVQLAQDPPLLQKRLPHWVLSVHAVHLKRLLQIWPFEQSLFLPHSTQLPASKIGVGAAQGTQVPTVGEPAVPSHTWFLAVQFSEQL